MFSSGKYEIIYTFATIIIIIFAIFDEDICNLNNKNITKINTFWFSVILCIFSWQRYNLSPFPTLLCRFH